MGQNNDPTEHGEPQGQQGGPSIPPAERKRQSAYPIIPASEQSGLVKTGDAAGPYKP
ncbi:MAG: hypothetical protein ISS15_01575 [Alphaproteobacteria bacterium]|nr:hypothetical protein [Alphaproteobacteria bacterium]MBL7096321.1 hypothetical protein [Alphaproteobacteria bacterium]